MEKKEEHKNINYSSEKFCGSFVRTLTLPNSLTYKKINVSFQDDFLSIKTLQKNLMLEIQKTKINYGE